MTFSLSFSVFSVYSVVSPSGVSSMSYETVLRERFGVVYGLLNVATGERVFVKTFVNEPDLTLPSAFDLWRGADWLEREVYDMYGIIFDGHPDLRRILMPEEFTAYPLRKDYPLQGRGERHNFHRLTRAEA